MGSSKPNQKVMAPRYTGPISGLICDLQRRAYRCDRSAWVRLGKAKELKAYYDEIAKEYEQDTETK